MNGHELIPLLGKLWFVANIITIAGIVGLIWVGKSLSGSRRQTFTYVLGALIILRAIVIHPYQLMNGTWSVQYSVPIQLCGMSAIIAGIVMFYRPQWLFEILFYWGIPGAFHSLMTPEFTLGTSGWFLYDYYLEHGGIWLGAFYLIFVYGMKPHPGSWWKVFLYSQALVVVVAAFNYIFDANYMYLCQPPIVENPFIIGPWPWYILGIELAGLLHFIIIYLPFGWQYRKQAATSATV